MYRFVIPFLRLECAEDTDRSETPSLGDPSVSVHRAAWVSAGLSWTLDIDAPSITQGPFLCCGCHIIAKAWVLSQPGFHTQLGRGIQL